MKKFTPGDLVLINFRNMSFVGKYIKYQFSGDEIQPWEFNELLKTK